MHKLLPASLALALAAPLSALAEPDSRAEIKALRQEIDAIRAAYERRLQTLEQRLQAAEATSANTTATARAQSQPMSSDSASVSPIPAATTPAAGSNAFNPAISLILSGLYTRTSQDPAGYAISGFHLPAGAEIGPGTRGLSLAESELGLSANVDPWTRGVANFALHPDDTVSVEEAYVQSTSLGHGLSIKAGRFFSGVGYLNEQHAHTWDFVDNPLVYQALLGTQYGDDGVQVTWLAPSDQFIQLGAELGRGRSYPGSDTSRNGAGMTALSAHTGGDIGDSHSWRAGVSMLNAKADEQALSALDSSGNTVASRFSGTTRVWVLDGVWKWAPSGNASRTSLKLQGEYLRSRREGSLTFDPGQTDLTGAYRSVQSGWYVQGVYQFLPGWRLGLRTERLDPGNSDYGVNAGNYTLGDYKPRKNSLMVDFSASEFSRIRLQLAQDRSREGVLDRQLQLQYQMSLGAHGAHSY